MKESMKTDESNERCRTCPLLSLCGKPYSKVCPCSDEKLANMMNKSVTAKVATNCERR